MELKIEIRINDVYDTEVFYCKSRELLIYGGAGSGKSYYVAQRLILLMISSINPIRIIYGRKVLRNVRQSQFALLKDVIQHLGLKKQFEINKTDMTIRFKPTGSEMIAIGIDDPEKLKSLHDPVIVWIEEATELSYEDDQQIKLRLRKPNSDLQIIYTFNPINKKHWIYKNYFLDNEETERIIPMGVRCDYTSSVEVGSELYSFNTSILKTNYIHNHYTDKTFIASLQLMKIKNPNYWRVYANAEWGELEDGLIFKRDYYQEYESIPADARGIAYCDPNLSKKGKGDTTAIFKLLYSSTTDRYYIAKAFCDTYSDSNLLLEHFLSLRTENCRFLGFDGNVSQESSWLQHVQNFCQIRKIPSPVIQFKRYRTDELSKNAQMIWNDGKILFPKGFQRTKVGETVLGQLFAFAGKKNTKVKDDAPDALICAIEYIIETGLASINKQQREILSLLHNKR